MRYRNSCSTSSSTAAVKKTLFVLLVIVYVIDMPHLTVSITTEQMIQWGLHIDDLDSIGRDNLNRYAPDLQIQLVESFEGGRAAIVAKQDGYDAARLLLGSLYERLAPELNGDFYVAAGGRGFSRFTAAQRRLPSESEHFSWCKGDNVPAWTPRTLPARPGFLDRV